LLGDAGKAQRVLGWKPRIALEDLAAEMIAADIKRLSR
jgi:GDPmannose 4,6-dehydratase